MIIEDRTFELLEKLYNRVEEGFREVKQDMARMEDKFEGKISALFDGLSANTEAVNGMHPK